MALLNQARGECAININGKPQKLCLTLGALAQLETAFAARDLSELGSKLQNLAAKDILVILAILLNAGGNPFEIEVLQNCEIDTLNASQAIAKAFAQAFEKL